MVAGELLLDETPFFPYDIGFGLERRLDRRPLVPTDRVDSEEGGDGSLLLVRGVFAEVLSSVDLKAEDRCC